MPSYNEYQYFEKYIKDCIKDNAPSFACYIVRVKSFDNLCVSVEILGNGDELIELSQVPIIQSNYTQPFIQKGDYGLILPLNNTMLNTLLEKENNFIQGVNEYVFLPFVLKSKALQGNGEKAQIISPNGEVSASINNDSIDLKGNALAIENKSVAINASDSISLESAEITQKGNNSISLESASISIKGDSSLAITSNAPLEIGATDTIGALINELIDIVSALAPVATSLGSPCTPDPAALVKLTALKAKILASFK